MQQPASRPSICSREDIGHASRFRGSSVLEQMLQYLNYFEPKYVDNSILHVDVCMYICICLRSMLSDVLNQHLLDP